MLDSAVPLKDPSPAPSLRDHAWRQELADTVHRVRLGGLFYLAGWIMVGVTDSAHERYPGVFVTVGIAFVLLAGLRLRRPPAGLGVRGARRWMTQLWMVIWLTCVTWSMAAATLLATSSTVAARVQVLVLAGAFATAMAHALPMRLYHAGAAIAAMMLPQLAILFARPGERLLGASLVIYLVYLLLALHRAHSEYWQRVALEEEIRAQRDHFEKQSRRDGLTGLPNRRRLDATLAALLGPDRGDVDVALILLDLDHFKSVNDRFGHAVGDRCLVEFAQCLAYAFNGTDELPARLGGEEFAVVLPHCGPAEATARAEALRQSLARLPMPADGKVFFITVSGGVVSATPGETGAALLARADVALYHAKRAGRNRIVPADAPVDKSIAVDIANRH